MVELTDQKIDVAKVVDSVTHPDCGAEVLFVGTTRQWTQASKSGTAPKDKSQSALKTESSLGSRIETDFLIYESYEEMALSQMAILEEQARQRWPIRHATIVHRLGKVQPSEASVAVAVSTPHRSEAFEAAKWLIDTLKHEIPIWKQEHYVQNGPEWIHPTAGNCNCESQGPTHAEFPKRAAVNPQQEAQQQ